MIKIYTEPRGQWFAARSNHTSGEYLAPTREQALHAVLLGLVGKGLLRYR